CEFAALQKILLPPLQQVREDLLTLDLKGHYFDERLAALRNAPDAGGAELCKMLGRQVYADMTDLLKKLTAVAERVRDLEAGRAFDLQSLINLQQSLTGGKPPEAA